MTTPNAKSQILLLAALLPLLALIPAIPADAQDWAGRGRLQGSVKDEQGKPVAGAKVTLYRGEVGRGPESFESNKKGKWSYLGLGGGLWSVLVEMEGKVTSEGSVSVSEFGANTPVNIVMRDIPEAELQADDAAAAVRQLDVGNKLLAEGKYAEARTEYESAMELLEPDQHYIVKLGIANSYQSEGNSAQAVAILEPLVTERPEDRQIQQAIARAYYSAGQVDQSLDTLKAMVESDANDVDSLRLLIDLLVRAEREAEAQTYMERLPEGETLSADTVLNTGIKLYNDGELDAALDAFNRAVADNPDLPEAFYFRGLAHLGKQQNDQAKADFQRFLEIAPEHAQASEAKEFLSYLESP